MYKHYFAQLIIYIGPQKKKNRKKRENRETDKKRKWINYLVGIVLFVSCIVAAIACSVAAITYIVPLLSYVSYSDQSQAENPTTFLACYKERITKHNLPSAPDPFIGRNIKVKQIMAFLKGNDIDIISINGPPAFGKSSLAIHVGYSTLSSGMNVSYIDASESLQIFKEARSTEVSLLEHATNPDSDLADIVRSFIHPTLLILDNLDSILEHNRETSQFRKIIAKIFDISSQRNLTLKILMTSQIHITFLDRFKQILINGLDPGAAVQLLNEIVHVNGSMSSKLVKLVGYCPLTIKVVAALLRKPGMEGGAWLLSKLERSGISNSCLDRTLGVNNCWKAVMDIAYSRLDDEGKECGHLVSCFPGSFDEFAAENILPKQYDCQSRLVDASLLKRYTHMNNQMVRYTMHNLIKEYFIKIDYQKSNIQEQFAAFFHRHYTNLVLNMSYNVLQAEPFSILEHFQIESHNWKELVTGNILRYGEKDGDKYLLLSIAFLHYKHLLPSNVSWLNILNIYNTNHFSIVCEIFSQTLCSEILLDTVQNIHETRPFLSCTISLLLVNVTEENKKVLSESLCYCNTQISIIYYLVSMPYNALVGVSVIFILFLTFIRVLSKIYEDKNSLFNYILLSEMLIYFLVEIYNKTITLLYNNIFLSVILLYCLIHPVSMFLCHMEWYPEGPQQLFIIILYFNLNILILILYQRIKTSTNKIYYNPCSIILIYCGSLFIYNMVIEKIFPIEYYKHLCWTGFVYSSIYLYCGRIGVIKFFYEDVLDTYMAFLLLFLSIIILSILLLFLYFFPEYYIFYLHSLGFVLFPFLHLPLCF